MPKNTGNGSRNATYNPSFRAARERGGSFEGLKPKRNKLREYLANVLNTAR